MELATLVQRAKEKDPKAFDTLYRTYFPQMLGVCMNIIHEDRQTASDLVHDAFLLAFVSIGSLKDNKRFSEWLTTIVRNVALKHVRRRDRLRVLPISSASAEEAYFIETSTPEADLNHKELLELISQLPEGYGKVLRLSVIEGFSHKEIADMLGIEPHSSSSQLARAKRLLRRMMAGGMVIAVLLLLLPYMFRYKEEKHGEVVTAADDNHDEQPEQKEQNEEKAALAEQTEVSAIATDTDAVTIILPLDIREDLRIAEAEDDSPRAEAKDSVIEIKIRPESHIAEEHVGKHGNWQIHVSGTIGQDLAQSDYRQLATHYSPPPVDPNIPEPDVPTYVVPKHVSTWEEYGKYLRFVSSPDATADTLALIEIADHNTDKIEQREHHNQPITFGISLAKPLGRKWSIGTGLQYSLLKSQFSLGEGGYAVIDKQKIHYLGIPLQVSYNWHDYKRLSAYSSLGVTLHIPVYGKMESNWLVNWQTVYSENRYFTPSLQWQTGISVGLQYKVAPHTSLFAEPTFNWFIPSGSDTHTIWTEHPFMFTCPFGVRISW